MQNNWITSRPWTTRLTRRPWLARKRSAFKFWLTRKRWMARRSRLTRNGWIAAAGVGALGAGLMYYFDPQRGRRRRSLLSDKAVHAGHELQTGIGKTGRDLRNRTKGAASGLRSLFRFRKKTEDEVLSERVRSHIGRAVSHPRSIEVQAQQGRVTLSGPVLAPEVEQLVRHVHSVHGVTEVENRLDVYEEPGSIPGLQGPGTSRTGERGIRQSQWSPAVRVMAGLGGGSAIAYGACRRGSIGITSAVAGSLLLVRAATNLEFRRLTGIGARRRAIDVRKSIHINAPVARVFAVWSGFESFPTFMSHVRSVRRLDDGRERERWRWTVDGPAGTEVEFDTVVTSFETDRLLSWRTESGSPIQHAGRIQFGDNQDGSTTVKIQMTYNPIAGALGHAVARLFGADPKHQLDDDLLRMKTYIETGKPPHDAAVRAAQQAPQSGEAPAPIH